MNEEKAAVALLSMIAILLCMVIVAQNNRQNKYKNAAEMTKEIREYSEAVSSQTVSEK